MTSLHTQFRIQVVPSPPLLVVDGARERSIAARLAGSNLRYVSLYEGSAADELGAFGPFLVETPTAAFETKLIKDIEPICIYLFSAASFLQVRQHLRHFLVVKLEDGRRVNFRYYDPRVLRRFLPTCFPDEWLTFFGPIDAFVVADGEQSEMLQFARGAQGRDPARVRFASC